MKYSFMSFSCPQLGLDQMLELARRLGYDAVEPRIASGHRHGIELEADEQARRQARTRSEESGIPLCCVATSCRYADPAITQQQVEETLGCIDLAADVGAPRIRVFGGNIPQGVSRQQGIELVVQALRSVADLAQQRGVTVCMETHDAWCDPQHVAEVMRRIDHSAIAVNWDIMHPVWTAKVTIEEAFDTLKPWIRHVHFHDGAGSDGGLELVPIGEGEVDHRRAVQLLKASSYAGYLSGEWINWEPYETHLPRELATMKRYEREAV